MVIWGGRCQPPFLRQKVVMRVPRCVSGQSWYLSSQRLYPHAFGGLQKSWNRFLGLRLASTRPSRSHDGEDRRPPGVRLAAAILECRPQLLWDAADNPQLAQQTRAEVFEKLKLGLPEKLRDSYSISKEYHSSLQKLVVEETLFSILAALKVFQSKTPQQLQKDCIRVHVTGDRNENPWFEAYSYQPISSWNRRNLRAGSVIVMVPAGHEYTDANVVFGVIKQGSEKSLILPRSMPTMGNDSTKTKMGTGARKKGKTATVAKGDRITFNIFGAHEVLEGDKLDVQYVTTILSLQRQFSACDSNTTTFGGALLGNKVTMDNWLEFAKSDFGPSLPEDLSASQMRIPALNESQQRACNAFLLDGGANIQIVQGPPGTGKTTMIIATIIRFFLRSRASSDKPKLMVCGPSNKSVVVLARKLLHCLGGSSALKVALIGDQTELLADHHDEIKSVYVHDYLPLMVSKWKDVETRMLQMTVAYDKYDDDTLALLSEMKARLTKTSFSEVLERLLAVQASLKSLEASSSEEKELAQKKFEATVRAVTMSVNNLDGEQIVRDLLGSADVVFCTLVASGSMPISRMRSVSALIVDEASACTEPEILIPLQKNPSRLLLVGDPKQLPAVITSPLASEYGLSRSLQDRLMFNMKFDFILLNEQYRMRPEISMWPLNNFYDDKVHDGENVKDSTYKSDVSLRDGNPYSWVQVSAEEKKDKDLSTFNEGEAEAVISLLLDMKQRYKLTNAWFSADRLRVITFYHAQVDIINRLLRRYNLGNVTVSTVDGSQGCEADIVVLSFVRGSSGHMGFLKDKRRLNVGLTRARFQLVCVGNLGAISYLDETGGHIPLVDLASDALSRVRVYKRPALPPPPGAKILDSRLTVTKSKQSRRKRAKAERMGKSESG